MFNARLWLLTAMTLVASAVVNPTSVRYGTASADQPAAAAAETEEQARERIWSSADMLRARAWLEDYFSATKKYTPQQAAKYREHLRTLTAGQMELWLMRFDHDRQVAHQMEAATVNARHNAVARDLSAIQQNRRDLQRVNTDENRATAEQERVIKSVQHKEEEAGRHRPGYGRYGPYHHGLPYSYHFHIY